MILHTAGAEEECTPSCVNVLSSEATRVANWFAKCLAVFFRIRFKHQKVNKTSQDCNLPTTPLL